MKNSVMKKMLAGFIVSTMLFSSVSVFAEDSTAESTEAAAGTPIALSWADIEASEGADELIASGDFVSFDEIDCKIWIPTVLEAQELSDEDKDAGYIGYYQTADGTEVAAVMYVNAGEDIKELEDYKAYLENTDGVSEITDVEVNGLPCVGYDMTENDVTCISFSTEAGNILEFSFYPASDEDYSAVILAMMASIQPASEEAEATESAA